MIIWDLSAFNKLKNDYDRNKLLWTGTGSSSMKNVCHHKHSINKIIINNDKKDFDAESTLFSLAEDGIELELEPELELELEL